MRAGDRGNGKIQWSTGFLYRFVHAGILLCVSMFVFGSFLGIGKGKGLYLAVGLCMILLLMSVRSMKVKGRIIFAVFSISFFVILVMTFGPEVCKAFLMSYGRWLSGGDWAADWLVGYRLVQTFLLSVICYAVQCILEKSIFFRYGAVCLLVCGLVFALLTGKPIEKEGVSFLLCYFVMTYAEWVQFQWKKKGNQDRKAYMLWMMPFFAGYFLILSALPAPAEPFKWEWVRGVFGQIRESFLIWSQSDPEDSEEDFDLTLSGFSEDGGLHDDLEENEREIMYICGNGKFATNVYLTGRIYDTFDGRQWEQGPSYEDAYEATWRFLDTAETLYAVRRTDRPGLQDYVKRTTLQVRYRYFNTAYIFVPLKVESIEAEEENLVYLSDGGSLLFPEKRGYGTEYETAYYQLNLGSEEWERLVEDAGKPDRDDPEMLAAILQAAEKESGKTITGSDYNRHTEMICDVYLDDPKAPESVKKYLDEVTAGAENDMEALRRLEEELSSYIYTLSPGRLPDTVADSGDFLEYFLLEGREGYCTYFATAFVLLARERGLPARYVQGFCVPMRGKQEGPVYADMAHSWPEVYFEGVGWIPFEPTPGYQEMRYTPWTKPEEAADASGAGTYPGRYGFEEENAEASEASREEVSLTARMGIMENLWKVASRMLLLAAISCVILFLGEHIWRNYRYRRMDGKQRFDREVREIFRLLLLIGLYREPGETLQEFKERAEDFLGTGKVTLQFLTDYETILYGGRPANPQMIERAAREKKEILELVKKRRKWAYWYYRMKFGRSAG